MSICRMTYAKDKSKKLFYRCYKSFDNKLFEETLIKKICLIQGFFLKGTGEGGGGGFSIFRWTGNEDFHYNISRILEKYGWETVFSTLDDAAITEKNKKESGFEIIKNGISIFGLLSKKLLF